MYNGNSMGMTLQQEIEYLLERLHGRPNTEEDIAAFEEYLRRGEENWDYVDQFRINQRLNSAWRKAWAV